MDLNLFRVFDAIYRAGSLTEAAKDLHITQPAVSNSLARLREHFDDPLFERRGRGIEPTALANSIAGDIAGALLSLQSSTRRAQQFDPRTSQREFVLSLPDPLELAIIPDLVQRLRDEAPGVRLQTLRLPRKQLGRQLAASEVSIALEVPQRVEASISQQAMLSDQLCVAMRNGHALAKTKLSLESYLHARHVSVSGRSRGSVYEDYGLERRGQYRDVVLRGQSYHSACHIVAETDLLLTLPRFLASHYQPLLALHISELPFPLPPMALMMYWHRSHEKDAAHAWLREQLKTQLDRLAQASSHIKTRVFQP